MGLHQKHCGLLNTIGYYDHLLHLLSHMAEEGFLRAGAVADLRVSADAEALVQAVLMP